MLARRKGTKRRAVVWVLVALMLLAVASVAGGCASALKTSYEMSDMAYGGKAMPAAAPAPAAPAEYVADAGRGTAYAAQGSASASPGQRYIIQNGFLYLEVRDIEESVAALQNLADQAGGYVASREVYNLVEDRRAGNVSLRIPAERFAPLLGAAKELGKVKNERVFTDDVTMQYIDLEARITNMAAQEKRLRELLQKAESIEDIMHVERELGRIRGDLEAMEGNFRYLRERVQYSSIDLQLEEKDPRTVIVDDKFAGFGERLSDLLALNTNRFIKGFSGFFLVAIGSLPILLPLLLIAIGLWKGIAVWKRHRARKKEAKRDLAQ